MSDLVFYIIYYMNNLSWIYLIIYFCVKLIGGTEMGNTEIITIMVASITTLAALIANIVKGHRDTEKLSSQHDGLKETMERNHRNIKESLKENRSALQNILDRAELDLREISRYVTEEQALRKADKNSIINAEVINSYFKSQLEKIIRLEQKATEQDNKIRSLQIQLKTEQDRSLRLTQMNNSFERQISELQYQYTILQNQYNQEKEVWEKSIRSFQDDIDLDEERER